MTLRASIVLKYLQRQRLVCFNKGEYSHTIGPYLIISSVCCRVLQKKVECHSWPADDIGLLAGKWPFWSLRGVLYIHE